jgi:hypothetical protein
MTDHLPAVIRPGALVASDDIHLVPVLIADAGDQAAWRYRNSSPPTSATRTHDGPMRAHASNFSRGATSED